MENHHFQWVNPLYMVIFNSKLLVYQRVFFSAFLWLWRFADKNRDQLIVGRIKGLCKGYGIALRYGLVTSWYRTSYLHVRVLKFPLIYDGFIWFLWGIIHRLSSCPLVVLFALEWSMEWKLGNGSCVGHVTPCNWQVIFVPFSTNMKHTHKTHI